MSMRTIRVVNVSTFVKCGQHGCFVSYELILDRPEAALHTA